jgi:hypothetical protein
MLDLGKQTQEKKEQVVEQKHWWNTQAQAMGEGPSWEGVVAIVDTAWRLAEKIVRPTPAKEMEAIDRFAGEVERAGDYPDLAKLQELWTRCHTFRSLQDVQIVEQHFKKVFGQDRPGFQVVRDQLAEAYFRSTNATARPFWGDASAPRFVEGGVTAKAYWFHATNEKSLEGILRDQQIRARKFIWGDTPLVWSSSQPELLYGSFVVVLNQTIAESSGEVATGCTGDAGFCDRACSYTPEMPHQQAAFTKAIPATKDTVVCIAIRNGENGEGGLKWTEPQVAEFKDRVRQWAGRDIPVVPVSVIEKQIQDEVSRGGGVAIPVEWPKTHGEIRRPFTDIDQLAFSLVPRGKQIVKDTLDAQGTNQILGLQGRKKS